MRPAWVEGERTHWVPIERFKVFERFQVAIHGCEVPDFHPIVKTTRDHFSSIAVDAKRLHGLFVAVNYHLVGYRQCMLRLRSRFSLLILVT